MIAPVLPGPRKVVSLVTSPAAGALVAQTWQAAASFVLQVVAAHVLGASGLGLIALCLGVVVLTTAVTSGFVGDSLTVLDRRDSGIRAGLQIWTAFLALVGPLTAAVVLDATGVLTGTESVLFLAAATLFQLEEVARRLLMATLRFWRLVVVDSTALVVALCVLVVTAATGAISLGTFLGGVALGQAAGLIVAVALAPADERRLVSFRGAQLRAVAAFGGWRGAQVAVNPSVFTGMRVLVVAALGTAALGQLESARIFVAPAMLAVQGFGSYLLASYARDRSLPLSALLGRARRSSMALAGAALAAGVALWATTPVVGPWVTGGGFRMPAVAVLGWAVYAAATATMQPFVSLAAARGRQRAALWIRLADGSLSTVALAAALTLGADGAYAPFALAVGPLVGGALTRVLVLVPMQRTGPGAALGHTKTLVAPARPDLRKAAQHAR